MRKIQNVIVCILFVYVFSLLNPMSVFAGNADSLYDFVDDDVYVYDVGDFLRDSEEEKLQEMAEKANKEIDMDVMVMLIDQSVTGDIGKLADKLINTMGSEYVEEHEDRSGVLLLVNMKEREMYISTKGIAILTINEKVVNLILDDIEERAAEEDFKELCQEFMSDVVYFHKIASETEEFDEVIDAWNTEKYIDYEQLYYKKESEIDTINKTNYNYNPKGIVTNDKDDMDDVLDLYKSADISKGLRKQTFFSTFRNIWIDLGIGAVIALIFILINRNPKREAMTATARTYRNGNDVKIHARQDVFLHRTTTKRVIESNSGGGGGGRGFHSSGGRSNGGGGRKF